MKIFEIRQPKRSMKEQPKQLMFVYGTLKQGFHNHFYLEGQEYLGAAVTVDQTYDIYGTYIPFLVADGKYKVAGELYSVDANAAEEIDYLEGYYEKRQIKVKSLHDSKIYTANAYMVNIRKVPRGQGPVKTMIDPQTKVFT